MAPSAGTTPPSSGEEAGHLLYIRNCAGCHRPLEKTRLTGRSASRIRSSIRQFPIMFHLRQLSDEEIKTLETLLADPKAGGKS